MDKSVYNIKEFYNKIAKTGGIRLGHQFVVEFQGLAGISNKLRELLDNLTSRRVKCNLLYSICEYSTS